MHAVTICSPTFDIGYSYGRIAMSIVEQLKARGIKINYVSSDSEADLPSNEFTLTPYAILLGHPTNFKHYGNISRLGHVIAVTMWESTILPKGWTKVLNGLDGVVSPCSWVTEIFQDNGVTVPILTSPLGVSDVFKYKDRNLNGRFRILVIGDRGGRKNWQGAGLAFAEAFGINDTSVEFVLKVHDDPDWDQVNMVDPNVTKLQADYTDAQMADLYASCHVLLFPSRSEGYGWPPLEMIRTGGVVICPDFAGLKIAVEHGAVAIPYTMEEAWQNDAYEDCGEWANPDHKQMVETLKAVRTNYNSFVGGMKSHSEIIASTLTWEYFVDDMLKFWKDVRDGK